MIRIHGKRVLAVLAFLMAIYVFFQLGLIRSTRSSFSDIVREQLDVENDVRQTPLRELKVNHTTTPTSQINYKSFLTTRRSCMQHYDLLIIISSAPSNFGRRNNIRKTWAFERSAKPRWTSVFLVAQTRDETVSNVLLDEDEALKDLVRASYYDHYWNQTRKIQMGFEWAITYCNFSFLLKLDDDVFVHVPRVLSFLSVPTTPKKMFYAGNHYTNPVPLREGNFGRRNNIRKTWAFERSAKPRWTSVFLVAQTRDETVSNVLLDEDEALKDLVRASYYDHYWNQTRKIQMGFEWAVTYCDFSFLLKLDDDVFVHVPRVLSFLSAPTTPKKMFYAGNHYTNPVPLREGNFGRRNNIRKTWAFERSAKPRWTSVFLVAQTRNETVSNVLLDEDEALKDVVRASYYDHYWNQTRKIQMGFEWAVTYCNFSFLLKLDDDVFVHVPRVLSFLSAHTTPKKMFYAGNHYTNPVPLREGKWKVTYEEYSGTRYPDFCPGFGYILSHDVVRAFVDTFSSLPFFRLDDVYVGMLASKNGINITNNVGFELWHPPQYVCVPTKNTLVRHDVGEECQIKMFNLAIFPQ
ncbi:uncharacterized protein [Pocillopora verrucosa]|uniref:uncharacterized protein isoform X2 n=1 Tax=Pocillopora verrucosa TaxID=203993 RepID=UPI0033418BEB